MTRSLNVNMTAVRKLIAVLAVLFVAGSTENEPSQTPLFSRADATKIIAEAHRIVNPGGIERLEKVRIGGIDQWVSIRGTDRRNPDLGMKQSTASRSLNGRHSSLDKSATGTSGLESFMRTAAIPPFISGNCS